DTGVTDRTLDVAREVAKDKYVGRSFAWRDDFAAARNFALDAAHELGAEWSVTLDTDERLDLAGEDLAGALADPSLGCLLVFEEGARYAKERFFRLPARARFTGPTHEAFPSYEVGARTLERARFRELPKTKEQYQAKFARDARVLAEHTRAH